MLIDKIEAFLEEIRPLSEDDIKNLPPQETSKLITQAEQILSEVREIMYETDLAYEI